MSRNESSGLLRIGVALAIFAATWFGLQKLRSSDPAPAPAPSSAPALSSAPAPASASAPAPALSSAPALPPGLLLAGTFTSVAATPTAVFAIQRLPGGSTRIVSLSLADRTERVLDEQPADRDPAHLVAFGDSILWTETESGRLGSERAIVAMRRDGRSRRELMPIATMPGGLTASAEAVGFARDGAIHLLPLLAGDLGVPKRVSVGLADPLGIGSKKIYWSTPKELLSTPIDGGEPRVEDSPSAPKRVQLFGVVGDDVVYAVDSEIKLRDGERTTAIEGDGSGKYLDGHVAGGDLYVALRREGREDADPEDVILRLEKGATKMETLPVRSASFDVSGETITYVAKDGLRTAPR
ncbi:MAG: hypothetical protein KF819_14940 [Labilithrix sp.]|nr:hypothetical protein [Labilithrix sp.]